MRTLRGIAYRAGKRVPMNTVDACGVSKTTGIANDTRGRVGPRQVTVLSVESWRNACGDLDVVLDWTTRRANLLIEGIELHETTDLVLQIGDAVELLVTGELEPCKRMDEAHAGLRSALEPHWRGDVPGVVKWRYQDRRRD